MITARGLSKRLGQTWALDSVDLDIETGETVALVGPNGAGKSTLLRLLAGLSRPSRGYVEIDGMAPRLAKSQIGFLGHESYLYPHLSVRENLEFFSTLYGLNGKHVIPVLEKVGIAHKSAFRAGSLSAGESQRAGLARALLHDPLYLILDEPSASLDRKGAESLLEIIRRPGRTTVVATHDLRTLGQIGGRTVQLDGGRFLSPARKEF